MGEAMRPAMDLELLAKQTRLTWLRGRIRREGSLAAALVQSMALAVIGTAGAYPSWVLVKDADEENQDIVLGASWAVSRIDPEPNSLLLGKTGGPIMFAIAYCCLLSVITGSLALTMDFLGQRRGRSWAPLLHGITAVLIASSSAGGSCLLAVIRGRVRSEPELVELDLSTNPGQSLFLSFLACVLAATATGLSCSSPARVQPERSSWDLGNAIRRVVSQPRVVVDEARAPSMDSVMWQEGCLPSPCTEDENLHRPRWYDYSTLEPHTILGSHSFLQSESCGSGAGRELRSRGSALSVEIRWPLTTPMPSAVTVLHQEDAMGPKPSPEEGTPQENAEGAPGPEREPEPERFPPPDQKESLTWREAVASNEAEPCIFEGPLLPEEREEARI